MKHLIFLLLLSACNTIVIGQRFLTPIFSDIEKTTDITYGSAINYQGNNETLLLDFYEPQNDPLDKRPLIIYAHGGGFTDVNQDKSLTHIVAYCDSMARRGYAVASIDYRLDSIICNRAVINAMHDMKAAIRFFRKEQQTYKIDPELIFVAGESAGGVTALTSSYIDKPSETAYPPTLPLAADDSLEGNSGNSGFSSEVAATLCLCAGTETAANELLFDPLAMESSDDPPLFQIHGTADLLITVDKALEVSIRANSIDLPFLFHTLEGATHCPWFFPLPNSWEYLDTLIEYTVPFLFAAIVDITPTQDLTFEGNDFKIYPNPTSGAFFLEFKNQVSGSTSIELYNLTGQLVFQTKVDFSNQPIPIDSYIESGIYLAKINTKEKEQIIKLVISKK